MKILIISGSPIMGGGELVARRLATGLARAGCQVIYVSVRPEKLIKSGVHHYIINTGPVYRSIFKNIRIFSYSLSYVINTHFALKTIGEIIRKEEPDLINIHIIKQSFWSPDLVGFCAERAPTVWTLHDMSSFTGRCAHSFSCTKYIDGCDATCPSIHIPFIIPKSLTRKRWLHHKRVLQEHPSVVAVCPSEWLAERARKSLWVDHRIEVIPNGIDNQVFLPIPKKQARTQLDLPAEKTLILIAAVDLTSPLKGGTLFREALKYINSENVGVVMMGNGIRITGSGWNIPTFNLGFVSPDCTPVVYSSVDLLVHPSKAESFGMVAIEANACGVPVLAFANSALQEIIKNGENGWLVQENTVEALAEKLNAVLQHIPNEQLSQSSRDITLQNYSLELQVERYIQLFNELLANRNNAGEFPSNNG